MAIATIKGELTNSEISSKFEVHPTQIGFWQKQALKQLPEIFKDKRHKRILTIKKVMDDLYKR